MDLGEEARRAIVDVLWSLLCLPQNSLDCSLTTWLKRIYFTIFGTSVPKFMLKWQEERGIQASIFQYDEHWSSDNMVDISAKDLQAKAR